MTMPPGGPDLWTTISDVFHIRSTPAMARDIEGGVLRG